MASDIISQRKTGVSGLVAVRNAVSLDYCVVATVKSLIPICNEVVVSDGGSSDGTIDLINSIEDSRIRILNYPWDNPVGDTSFLVRWLNWTRERLAYDFYVTLDADEVLDPGGYLKIRELAERGTCGLFERLNFWRDIHRLAPKNTVCGDTVARCGPTSLYCCSDEPHPAVSPNLRERAEYHGTLRIFHYGFIREPRAFVRKSKDVQTMFMGSCDNRLLEMEAQGRVWNERDYFGGVELDHYSGPHPEVAHEWLRAKGYQP